MASSSNSFQFSAAVAGFAQILRGDKNLSTMAYNDIIDLAQRSKGQDKYGYRAEFIKIVKLAQALAPSIDNEVMTLVRNKQP
jgi:Ca-activated chloride channel family protein